MLTYFGEPAVTHTDQCCQLAAEPLPLAALGLMATHDEPTATIMSWDQHLAQLFLPNS